ncbi:MAG: hypothetical protein AAB886_01635 [Patescibacteria group bacterium]
MPHPFSKISAEEFRNRERKAIGVAGIGIIAALSFAVFQVKTSVERADDISAPFDKADMIGRGDVQNLLNGLEETAKRAEAAREAISAEVSKEIIKDKAQDAVTDAMRKEILNQGIRESTNSQ